MGIFKKLRGTLSSIFQFGLGGAQIKNSSGVLESRNAADDAYAIVRGGTPITDNDLSTKDYSDALVSSIDQSFIVTAVAHGGMVAPNNTSTEHCSAIYISGIHASVGDLWYDNGSSSGLATKISAKDGRLIYSTIANTAMGILENKLHTWDGTSWANPIAEQDYVLESIAKADQSFIVTAVAHGSIAPNNTSTEHCSAIYVDGIHASVGDLWHDNGSASGSATKISAKEGRLIYSTIANTTIGILENKLHTWDGASWANLIADQDYVSESIKKTDQSFIVTAIAHGNNVAPNNTSTDHYSLIYISGIYASVGDLWYDNGSALGSATLVPAKEGRLIYSTIANTTIGILENKLHTWDGTSWANPVADQSYVDNAIPSAKFIFRIDGNLNLATGTYDRQLITSDTTVTKLSMLRSIAGSAGGPTQIKIFKNNTTSISGTTYPSVAVADGDYASDTITFSAVSLAVGDHICLEIVSAETDALDLFAKLE